MDWIEHVFHVSPDGGNGMIEALIYAVLAALLVLGIAHAWRRSALRRRRSRREVMPTAR